MWKNMKKKLIFNLYFIILIIMIMMIFSPVVVKAGEILVWEGIVYADGAEVHSITLEYGEIYRIVAQETFLYDDVALLAADAQYYTTDPTDPWNWGNHFLCPGGHSFLQINGGDVDWGPFSNGDTGHTYSIYYSGEGAPITFKIVDWMDDDYENNFSHFPVKIYWMPSVGGNIVGSNILKVFPLLTFCAFIVALLTTGRIINIRRNHIS